jgi:hypothetical protein
LGLPQTISPAARVPGAAAPGARASASIRARNGGGLCVAGERAGWWYGGEGGGFDWRWYEWRERSGFVWRWYEWKERVRTDRSQASGMKESGDGKPGSPNRRRRSAGSGAGLSGRGCEPLTAHGLGAWRKGGTGGTAKADDRGTPPRRRDQRQRPLRACDTDTYAPPRKFPT